AGQQWVGALSGDGADAGAGWLIGASKDKISKDMKAEARQASDRGKQHPARISDVNQSQTADLNHDGFVTLDEVIAMQNAGLSDLDMLERLRRGDQVFDLNTE